MPGLRLLKPFVNAFGGNSTDIGYIGQFFHRGIHQVFQIAEGRCQGFSGFSANLTDTQGENQPGNILVLAGLNGIQQLLGGLGPGFPESGELLQGQIIDVCRCVNGPLGNETVHNGAAKAFNIHGIPADKMGNVPAQLGGALRTGAAQECPILVPLDRGTADRTIFRQKIGHGIRRAAGQVNLQNFGDDLPCLADFHRIADADIQPGDKVLIVQGGIGHGGSRQLNGTDHGLGGQNTGTPHLNDNILYHRQLFFRRVLIGNGPPGEFGGGP